MHKTLTLTAALILGATAAQAQTKEDACLVSKGFVAQAVEMRVAGQTADETQQAIKDSITENKLLWSLVVGPLVKQVYDLPEDKMTEDFPDKFLEACLSQ